MPWKPFLLSITGLLLLVSLWGCTRNSQNESIGMAVEFTDHAACAYIAQHKGWYQKNGLKLSSYENYVTGMALASALARGDIQVAYICLIPAINAFANAKVPIRIVAGTHKYGYSLVVDPDKVKTVDDLERPGIRLGCVREGGAVDVILHRFINRYNLDENPVLKNIQRMNPPMQVMAIKTGRLDAAFIPEHHATVAEKYGFKMLVESKDVWPEMQGSVLAIKKSLIDNHPEMVRKLVSVTQQATDWAKKNKYETASIMAKELQASKGKIFPAKVSKAAKNENITAETMHRSMWDGDRLAYTTDIDPYMVQDIIDYMAQLGYIKDSFPAKEILDLRILEQINDQT